MGVNFVMGGRTEPSNSDNQNGDGGGLVCARVCVCTCVCAFVRTCVRDVFTIYDNNILPRLIMIIIKIIFLYFIEIAHTDVPGKLIIKHSIVQHVTKSSIVT